MSAAPSQAPRRRKKSDDVNDDEQRPRKKNKRSGGGGSMWDSSRVHPNQSVRSLLVTTVAGKEQQCAAELRNCLDRIADDLYGDDDDVEVETGHEEEHEEQERDVASGLEAELAELRGESLSAAAAAAVEQVDKESDGKTEREVRREKRRAQMMALKGVDRFQRVRLKDFLRGMVFIHVRNPRHDPRRLAARLFEEVLEAKGTPLKVLEAEQDESVAGSAAAAAASAVAVRDVQHTRFAMRVVPFSRTCFPRHEDIVALAKEVVDRDFCPEQGCAPGSTYAVVYNKTGPNKIDRDTLQREVSELVPRDKYNYRVQYKKPDHVVYVAVCGNFAGVAVLNHHRRLRKWNLREVIEKGLAQ